MNGVDELDEVIFERFHADDSYVFLSTHPDPAWIEEFGPTRIRTCSISEPTMIGAAVGAALTGLRPVVDLNRASFAFVAMEQIANQAAKLAYVSGGQSRMPLTVTFSTGGGFGFSAQSEVSPYSMFMQVPGLRVAIPGTLADARGLLRTALMQDHPSLFFVSLDMLRPAGPVPAVEPVPFGVANRLRAGQDITLVAIGGMTALTLAAADQLREEGISCDVYDPRTLVPLDLATIAESVTRTGHLLVVDEAPGPASAASEIIAGVTAEPAAFTALRAAPRKICALATPIPFAASLKAEILPNAAAVVAAARDMLGRGPAG